MDTIKDFIVNNFELNPYSKIYIGDLEDLLLKNKKDLQNIEVFIRNGTLLDKIISIIDELVNSNFITKNEYDSDLSIAYESCYIYYPNKVYTKRINDLELIINHNTEIMKEMNKTIYELRNDRINELEKTIEDNSNIIEDLQTKLDNLTLKVESMEKKDEKKKFWLF
jgi:uncharacterized coiled-coil protein SlyX